MKTGNRFKSTPIRVAMVALLAISAIPVSYPQESTVAPLAVTLDEIQWGEPGGGDGFPVGVQTARQGIDPVTGGITYYALFPSGSHFDMHWHSHDEFVVVVQGQVVIELGGDTHTLGVGSYVVIPGNMHHSWDVPSTSGEDAVIVVRRGGPADFHFIN